MRECNKCKKYKTDKKFRHENKKTCSKCEFRFRVWLLRQLVYTNTMELSCIKYKWVNSLGNSPFNKFTMTIQNKLDEIKSLHKMIIELKSNPSVESKKTIQRLQQKLDGLKL